MRYRPTGIGFMGVSLNWDSSPGDQETAKHVVNYLEDRRLPWGDRQGNDYDYCIQSALEIREFLTGRLN